MYVIAANEQKLDGSAKSHWITHSFVGDIMGFGSYFWEITYPGLSLLQGSRQLGRYNKRILRKLNKPYCTRLVSLYLMSKGVRENKSQFGRAGWGTTGFIIFLPWDLYGHGQVYKGQFEMSMYNFITQSPKWLVGVWASMSSRYHALTTSSFSTQINWIARNGA